MMSAHFKGGVIGAIAGFTCGAAVTGGIGGVAGAAVGVVFGVGLTYLLERMSASLGPTDPQLVEDKVYCYPRGHYAEGEFVRDLESGRWLDVKRCDLCQDGKPDCHKDCLRLLNDVDRKPAPREAEQSA